MTQKPLGIQFTDTLDKENNVNRFKTSSNDFAFELKPKRALWKDICIFLLTSVGIWSSTHLVMNFSAYADIVAFKYANLKASIIENAVEIKKELDPPAPVFRRAETIKSRVQNTRIKPQNYAREALFAMDIYPSDNRIIIPRINKNVPLVQVPTHKNWEKLEKSIQTGLRDGVVVHPISRSPGSFGNFFLTGHSSYYLNDPGRYKDVFALLHELKEGDRVEVYWQGKKYVYQLDQQRIIEPTETSVLRQPNNSSIITLMTCTPIGTANKRLIWTGKLIRDSQIQL